MKNTTAQSKGKVIISGEHSVVYGMPALVGSIKLFREVVLREPVKRKISQPAFVDNLFNIFEKKFGQSSHQLEVVDLGKLPIGSGLGSSAAYAHAVFLSLLKHFNLSATKAELYEMVQESERFAHGNPSGVDATAVVYGGLLEFFRKEDAVNINQLGDENNVLKKANFYLIDSGRPVESTKEMIAVVSDRVKSDQVASKVLEQIGELTTKLITQVRQNTFEVNLLQDNEKLLELLGVVGEKAQKMIAQLEEIGAVAKITGAGGVKDGSGMLLVYAKDQKKLANLIKEKKWKSYQVTIG
jgi:mevalonate kinase